MIHFTEYDKRAAVCEGIILIGKKETMQKQCTLPLTWKTFGVEFLWCYEILVLLFRDLLLFLCNLNMCISMCQNWYFMG